MSTSDGMIVGPMVGNRPPTPMGVRLRRWWGRQSLHQQAMIGVGAFVLATAAFLLGTWDTNEQVGFSVALQMADRDDVQSMVVRGNKVTMTVHGGQEYTVRIPPNVDLVETLDREGVDTKRVGLEVKGPTARDLVLTVLAPLAPMAMMMGLFYLLYRRMSDIGGRDAIADGERPDTRFEDVAGLEEAKQEMWEIIYLLSHPKQYEGFGVRAPRGMLMSGPPGTGKTLLARAAAGEANAAFFAVGGSRFVEMIGGLGASRVRELFRKARRKAPAIIFIDELDAIGAERGSGGDGSLGMEYTQVLNELLAEMDGFRDRDAIAVIAATNRPEVLDPALLRPGRFDRRIQLDIPDVIARESILRVHTRDKTLSPSTSLMEVAQETAGYTGADLENICNEAAIASIRRGATEINIEDMRDAIDRVTVGPERKHLKVEPHERRIAAYHEAGHALAAHLLDDTVDVQRISIVPRGDAGGYTRLSPRWDVRYYSHGQMEAMLAVAMGGRAAEELEFGEVTTGPREDLKLATTIARDMVTKFGMSDLGPGVTEPEGESPEIDEEIRNVVGEAYATVKALLEEHRDALRALAEHLLVKESMDAGELAALLPVKGDAAV